MNNPKDTAQYLAAKQRLSEIDATLNRLAAQSAGIARRQKELNLEKGLNELVIQLHEDKTTLTPTTVATAQPPPLPPLPAGTSWAPPTR